MKSAARELEQLTRREAWGQNECPNEQLRLTGLAKRLVDSGASSSPHEGEALPGGATLRQRGRS